MVVSMGSTSPRGSDHEGSRILWQRCCHN
jgi:hypothetical protein